MIPRRVLSMSIVAAVLAFGAPLLAQKSSTPPKNATAQCQDGTYGTAKTEKGACAKHGGVKTWFGSNASNNKGNAKSSENPSGKSSEKPSSTTAAVGAKGTASAAASAPKGATAECKDGSYSRAKTRERACTKHGGVAQWFADNAAAGAASQSATAGTSGSASTSSPKSAPSNPKQGTAPKGTAGPGVPEGATAKCKDGTYSFAKGHTGACSHHGGVAEWFK